MDFSYCISVSVCLCVCVWMPFTCVALAQWCFYLFPGNLMSVPELYIYPCGRSEKEEKNSVRALETAVNFSCLFMHSFCRVMPTKWEWNLIGNVEIGMQNGIVYWIAIYTECPFKETLNFLVLISTSFGLCSTFSCRTKLTAFG